MRQKTIISPAAVKYDTKVSGLEPCTVPAKYRCKYTHLYLPYVSVPVQSTWGTFKVLDMISWETAAQLERLKAEL